MKKFDPNKKIQTRDGKPARIIALNAQHERYPIIALVTSDGNEAPSSYTVDGHLGSSGESSWDLVNVPAKRVLRGWINTYFDGTSPIYRFKTEADAAALSTRLACIEINREYTEGDGL